MRARVRRRAPLVAAAIAVVMLLPSVAPAASYDEGYTQQVAFPDITSQDGTSANATSDKATGNLEVGVEARSALPAGMVLPFANVGVGGATAAANAVIVDREPWVYGTTTVTVAANILSGSATASTTGIVVPGVTAASAGVGLVVVFQGMKCTDSIGTPPCYGYGDYVSDYVPLVCAPYACASPGTDVTISKTLTPSSGSTGVITVVYLTGSATTQGSATARASLAASITSITYG